MGLHEFTCIDCGAGDKRLAGIDDSVAVCQECGGLMLRTTDPWTITLWDEAGEKEVAK